MRHCGRQPASAGEKMRCFTVTESSVSPGISITWEPYPHIGVGEKGRGREYTRFPIAHRFAETLLRREPCFMRGKDIGIGKPGRVCDLCGQEYKEVGRDARLSGAYLRHPDAGEMVRRNPVERASVLRTKEKGTLLLVEEKDPADRRALVLANIAAGYRGSTTWTDADREEVPCPSRGTRKATYRCDLCGIHYPAYKGEGQYDSDMFWSGQNIHPDAGTIYQYAPFPPDGITVLAEGYCAQGTAGRMGGHVVRLLIMEPGVCFRVVRHGRLYGAPAARYVYWDGENLRLGTRDEIFPPACEAPEGELV